MCFQLPRAVSTQALSGAGFLKMINKATDAVSKMTIKMNESDVVSSAVDRYIKGTLKGFFVHTHVHSFRHS